MEAIVLCPACGHQNGPEDAYCPGCRTRLDRGRRVTSEEAQDLDSRRRDAIRKRRNIRWGLAAAVLMLVAGWAIYSALGGVNRLVSPETDISASPTSNDWPMYQRSPDHAASVTDPVPIPQGRVRWTFETPAPIRSSPAVVKDALYMSTGDGRMVALDPKTGELIWEREVVGPVDSSPAVAGDLVFVGLKDGRLLAMERGNGMTRWEFLTGDLIYSSPAVYRGVVYIGSSDGSLYALDAATGRKRWSYSTEGRIMNGAAVRENIVSMNSQDRHIYVLDADTGKHRLDLPTYDTRGAPALDAKMAYVADARGMLMAIDLSKRELPFEKTARWIRTQLWVWNMVSSLPPPKGFAWRFRNPRESFVGTPVIGDGVVYVASESGAVFAVDAGTGKPIWRFKADADVAASPSVAGGTLYVGDADGVLHGINASTGKSGWRFQVDGAISSTPVVANGMVYLATKSGTLYAIE